MAKVNVSSCPSSQMLLHPTHIHPLYEVDLPVGVEYTCDGCQTFGCEKSYRCNVCDFDLHEYCATCPSKLESRMHKHHQLTLVYQSGNDNMCDLCEEDVEGLFYTCSFCDFSIHPLCTQIPQKVQHDHLPNHSLTLRQPRATGWCIVCHDECASWRYRCDICRFDVHLECVYEPFDDSTQRESSPSYRSIPSRSGSTGEHMGQLQYQEFDEPTHFESPLQSRSIQEHMGSLRYESFDEPNQFESRPCSQFILAHGGPPRYEPLDAPTRFVGPFRSRSAPPRSQSIQAHMAPIQPTWNNPPRFHTGDLHDYPVVVSNRGRRDRLAGNRGQNGNQGKRRSKRRKVFSAVAKLAANVVLGSVIGVTPFVNIDFWEN